MAKSGKATDPYIGNMPKQVAWGKRITPPLIPGLNQLDTTEPPTQTPTPLDQMRVFQGFQGPYPGSQPPIDPNLNAQQRAMARLDSLSLPPQVLERLKATLNGQQMAPPSSGGGGSGSKFSAANGDPAWRLDPVTLAARRAARNER
jgi:hypothetical protein